MNTVVNICKEMVKWKGHRLSGVDNQCIPESFLVTSRGTDNFSSFQAGCEAIDVDSSSFIIILTLNLRILLWRITKIRNGFEVYAQAWIE
jgi:hypothetical protein